MSKYFVLFLLLITLFSCGKEVNLPDVSHLEDRYNTFRCDSLLASADSTNYIDIARKLNDGAPVFFSLYTNQLIPLYDRDSVKYLQNLQSLMASPNFQWLADTTLEVHADFSQVNEEFAKAYQYMQYYLPNTGPHDVYTYVSEFSHQIFLFNDKNGKNCLGIGLDMFLGETFDYKGINPQNPSFSAYLTRTFNQEHIVPKAMTLILQDYMGLPTGNRLLDHMIHNGKLLYAMDQILPTTHDSIIHEYSQSEWDWVLLNEKEMWAFFMNEDLIYESKRSDINKYISHSPNSPGMPDVAPGRTANYLGWKIVESYMKRNPDLTLDELFLTKDAQKIMNEARYKPRLN